jgi:signal transduction histidine kinase
LIHPDHDAVEDLILKLRDTAAVMLGTIDYSFACTEEALKRISDIGFKRNLFLVFKEILHNIVRHASATHVTIQITESRRLLEMTITDNGIGFDPSVQCRGNGLNSLRNRAAQMRGTVDIKSHPGEGTTITVTARIP